MKNKYSLWIVPPEELEKRLQETITQLSKEFNAPDFKPHITLLESFEEDENKVIEKARNLKSQLSNFQISFSEVSFSTTYFQCVFLRVKSSATLMDANLKAKEIFNYPNKVFMPHLSILYGDFGMEKRQEIASRISIPENSSFNLEKMKINLTSDDPKTWRQIDLA